MQQQSPEAAGFFALPGLSRFFVVRAIDVDVDSLLQARMDLWPFSRKAGLNDLLSAFQIFQLRKFHFFFKVFEI